MGRNYFLVCREHKEYVWIGQGQNGTGYMDIFYSNEKDIMDILIIFLNNTKGKSLVVLDEHSEEMCNFIELKKVEK